MAPLRRKGFKPKKPRVKSKLKGWYTRRDRRYKSGPKAGQPVRRPTTDFERSPLIIIQAGSPTPSVHPTPTPTVRQEPDRIKLSGKGIELSKILDTLSRWDAESFRAVMAGKSLKPEGVKVVGRSLLPAKRPSAERERGPAEEPRREAEPKDLEAERLREERERLKRELALKKERARIEKLRKELEKQEHPPAESRRARTERSSTPRRKPPNITKTILPPSIPTQTATIRPENRPVHPATEPATAQPPPQEAEPARPPVEEAELPITPSEPTGATTEIVKLPIEPEPITARLPTEEVRLPITPSEPTGATAEIAKPPVESVGLPTVPLPSSGAAKTERTEPSGEGGA